MLDFYQREMHREKKRKKLHLPFWILIARVLELLKLRVYKFCKYRYIIVDVSKKDS